MHLHNTYGFLLLVSEILCNINTFTCIHENDSVMYQNQACSTSSIGSTIAPPDYTSSAGFRSTSTIHSNTEALTYTTQSATTASITRTATTIVTTELPIEATDKEGNMEESFNYASFDCGALIRSANKEATHATAILQNSKDAYMLNPCSAEKFVEIEVCQSILVKEITMANFEFFSSQFKDFAVYGSSKLPPEWILLGNFTAKNARDRQHFTVKDPKIWSKHVRVQIISHYGTEFYCPLTSIQIFGTTMLDDPIILLPSSSSSVLSSTVVEETARATQETICPIPHFFTIDPSTSDTATKTAHITSNDTFETSTPSSQTFTPSPTPIQQESVFAKIMHRIVQLEKGSVQLESDFGRNKDESSIFIKQSTALLESHIEEQLVGLQALIRLSMDDLETKKTGIDERLAHVTHLLEDLKVQLSWAQFWNHIILFLGAICLKIVNDRLNVI